MRYCLADFRCAIADFSVLNPHINPFKTRTEVLYPVSPVTMRHEKSLSVAFIYILAVRIFALNIPTDNLALISPENLTTTHPTLTYNTHVQCIRITDPPQPGLHPTHCQQAIANACSTLTAPYLRPPLPLRDQWVWSDPLRGCSLGWFLPEMVHVPLRRRCVAVFEAIVDECATRSQFNAGSVNVGVPPSLAGGDGTGIVPGAVRYVMAPQRLTRE